MATPRPELQLLIDLYDPLDPDRVDLEAYLAMVDEFGAKRVLDLGCGTGVFALLLAERGIEVTGIDPSIESLVVAQRSTEPARRISIYGEERPVPIIPDLVTWIHGTAADLPDIAVDLVTCTGNAMQQVFVDDASWKETLTALHRVLAPRGRVIFETRDPAYRAWEGWVTANSPETVEVPGHGPIEVWTGVESITESPLIVTIRGYMRFVDSGVTIESGPEVLRFRDQTSIRRDLETAGFAVDEIREAPDRPGREWVFIARRRA